MLPRPVTGPIVLPLPGSRLTPVASPCRIDPTFERHLWPHQSIDRQKLGEGNIMLRQFIARRSNVSVSGRLGGVLRYFRELHDQFLIVACMHEKLRWINCAAYQHRSLRTSIVPGDRGTGYQKGVDST